MDKSISVESLARQNCASILLAREAAAAMAPKQCKYCDRKFLSSKSLNKHHSMHRARARKEAADGGAPTTGTIKCPDCPLTFESKHALSGHKSIHRKKPEPQKKSEEKPFQRESNGRALKLDMNLPPPDEDM